MRTAAISIAVMLAVTACAEGREEPQLKDAELAKVDHESKLEECKGDSDLASSIMRARQYGMPMNRAMEIVSKHSPALRAQEESMIRAAYGEPRFNTDEMVERSVVEFSNQFYLACLELDT